MFLYNKKVIIYNYFMDKVNMFNEAKEAISLELSAVTSE